VTSIATGKVSWAGGGLWPAVRKRGRLWLLLAVVAVWVVLWAVFQGQDTLPLPPASTTR
jgi:nitric oxide reductase large subunit